MLLCTEDVGGRGSMIWVLVRKGKRLVGGRIWVFMRYSGETLTIIWPCVSDTGCD